MQLKKHAAEKSCSEHFVEALLFNHVVHVSRHKERMSEQLSLSSVSCHFVFSCDKQFLSAYSLPV